MPGEKVEKLNLRGILKWYFGKGSNLMTLERCLIFSPYMYLPGTKCRDLTMVASGRLSVGPVAGMNGLLVFWF